VPEAGKALLFGNRVGLCVAWRREVWEKVGGFNREFDTAEDFEYWLRIWDQFPIQKCAGAAPMLVRDHAAMGSRRFADRQEITTIRILKERYPVGIPWVQRLLLRRKAISRIRFSAAADYSEKGLRWRALGRIVRSLAGWPLPYRREEVKMPLARARLLGALLFGTRRSV
jgi:GT2 family glycosyltransferase